MLPVLTCDEDGTALAISLPIRCRNIHARIGLFINLLSMAQDFVNSKITLLQSVRRLRRLIEIANLLFDLVACQWWRGSPIERGVRPYCIINDEAVTK